MSDTNPELKDVSDVEICFRINILMAIVAEGISNQDARVHNPLGQVYVLLSELMARHPKPVDQVVRLASLDMRGDVPNL